MPTIRFKLNSNSISDAIKQLENYSKKVSNLETELTKELTLEGVELAKSFAAYMDAYDTGELVRSIHDEFSDNVGYVRTSAPHAAYVEFGTGIKGAASTHPDLNKVAPGWTYDKNQHGVYGWAYIGDDGKLHFTQGMPSRPFMYYTAKQLRRLVPDFATKLLKDGDTND